jgi:integrase
MRSPSGRPAETGLGRPGTAGSADPVAAQLDTDGHVPRDWLRQQIWDPAVKATGIDRRIRVRDLRHAHASWVLAGGADLQTVRERLGHAGLRATERYLHTLPDADETALEAFARTRAGARWAAAS